MKVEIEYLLYVLEELRKINVQKLSDIEFTIQGKKVEFTYEVIEKFENSDVRNSDFIASRFFALSKKDIEKVKEKKPRSK